MICCSKSSQNVGNAVAHNDISENNIGNGDINCLEDNGWIGSKMSENENIPVCFGKAFIISHYHQKKLMFF